MTTGSKVAATFKSQLAYGYNFHYRSKWSYVPINATAGV